MHPKIVGLWAMNGTLKTNKSFKYHCKAPGVLIGYMKGLKLSPPARDSGPSELDTISCPFGNPDMFRKLTEILVSNKFESEVLGFSFLYR